MKIWKKNLVAAAVLVTVCAGIYLNWQYTEADAATSLTDTLDADKILDDSMLVMNSDAAKDAAAEDANTTSDDYFAAVRLSRQEARDSAVALIQEAMSYDTAADTGSIAQELEDIVQVALREAQIESLIVAKGYTDCVAYMTEEGISVAVAAPENGLQQEDIAVITDVITSQSDYAMADISIVEVQ